ncbi:MAG: ribose 5-phosphate isomerase B [Actinomycetia bacterium]|nr:ribose 5-phosphate isomerase B [Actinomycetes bacterium]
MNIIIGSDHAGIEHKAYLADIASRLGHKVTDLGTYDKQSVDYPDIAFQVACNILNSKTEIGILICGTGIGMSLAANKVRGIRAAVCWNQETARLARQHNNANILCLGARILDQESCKIIMEAFLANASSSQDRHARRVEKIMNIEERTCTGE